MAGAFGAHALRERLPDNLLRAFETGTQYHVYHALGLVLLGLAMRAWPDAVVLRRAALLMLIGIVLFCGSLYALALSGVTVLGAITPLGGLALIAAWLTFAWGAWRR
ncbi:MAG: DUF423 domain-containing protein [Pseudomonadota bacterium]